jgi:hypothetical protein
MYTQNVENPVGSEWSNSARDTTPLGGREFLGRFSNDTVRLSVNTLPLHSFVTVSFDLFIIQSWDRDGTCNSVGRDLWSFAIAGVGTLLNTTFANFNGCAQSYPDNFGAGSHPAYTGAAEVNTLGYFWLGTPRDGVYRLTFTVPHTGSSIAMDFTGSNLQGVGDESWGLDNVVVEVAPPLAYQQWGGNGHYYGARLAPSGITWQDAQNACMGEGSYLATVTSAEENAFIFGLVSNDSRFWFIDGAGNGEGPLLGGFQPSGSPEPSGGWRWAVTDEPFVFAPWASGEPNNAGGAGENRLVLFKVGGLIGDQWNDVYEAVALRGYICERATLP